jgi:polyferredoxin
MERGPDTRPPRARTRRRSLQRLRYGIQAAVAVYVLVIAVGNTVGGVWAANLHTICPFGGVANLYTYLVDGDYVAKLHSAVFIMLLALIIGLVLTGKSFCGWICPLGTVQQALGWLGVRLWPRGFDRIPHRVERWLQYLKFVVLVWVLVQTARSGRLIFEDWDPYFNLFHIWTDTIAWSGYLVVGLTLVLALFIPRAFCRFGCPLGAFNGLFNSFSFMQIERDATSCNRCGRCDKVCPMSIPLSTVSTVSSPECTRCLKCVEACPMNSRGDGCTLKIRTWLDRLPGRDRARRLQIPRSVFAGLAVAAFVVPILVTNLSGDFITTGGGRGGGSRNESSVPREGTGTDDLESGEAERQGEGGQVIGGRTTLAEVQALVRDYPGFLDEFGICRDEPVTATLSALSVRWGFEMP